MTYTAYAVDNARLFQEAREAAQRLQEVVEDQKLRLTLAQQQMLETAKLSALGGWWPAWPTSSISPLIGPDLAPPDHAGAGCAGRAAAARAGS